MMKGIVATATLGFALVALVAHAAPPAAGDFAWRATLGVPEGAGMARVELPASALAHMQSATANDLRIFNASGEAVPFAWTGPPASAAAPEEKGAALRAMPLFSLPANGRVPSGSVQVRVDGAQPVWVRVDGKSVDTTAASRVAAALFDTRSESRPLAAIDVQATLPANTPVRIGVSVSTDLSQWRPVAARGRLYRFDGESAPSNMRLVFDSPLAVKDHYLRIDWQGNAGVSVDAVTGVYASAVPAPRRVRAALGAMRESSEGAVEVTTGFATPIAALVLSTPRDNSLAPVRVFGRNDASQPWRVLGQTVVYRLNGNGAEATTNPPLDLHASARELRIVSTNGAALAPMRLRADVEFTPMQLVFVASGPAQFTLAAGRAQTDAAALPAATLTGTLGPRKVQDLPLATLGPATESADAPSPAWLPRIASKSNVLWAVLILGVALLGAAAWSLMRAQSRA